MSEITSHPLTAPQVRTSLKTMAAGLDKVIGDSQRALAHESTLCPLAAVPAAVPAILEAQLHHAVMLAHQAGKADEPIGGQALLAMERLRALIAVELEKAREAERLLRPDLEVNVTQMRESNGNVTHSVYLHPKGVSPVTSEEKSYSIYHSASKGRADYEADCLRHFLDRSLPEPCVLDYDTELPPIA